MRWDSISFLHWPYKPATIAALLPGDLEPHTIDGQAWVSITPFVMGGVRPPGLPPVPTVSTFPETNVRTYVRHRASGRDGLWFLSLDTIRSPALAARVLGLPYAWSRMAVERRSDSVSYETRRRRVPHDPDVFSRIGITIGARLPAADLSDLDHFLTGRWRAFSRAGPRLWCTPVQHPPWPLHAATTLVLDFNLMPSVGLPSPAGTPLVHCSDGVDVRLGAPRPV